MTKPGDIVIFEAGDNWLSKSICWLTKSTVSHAAMVLEDNRIVEMGGNGIAVSKFVTVDGENAHILRMQPEMPVEPLIKAAQVYVDDGIGYDFPALVLLAGLLIYRDTRPTPGWQRITDLILTGACTALDKLLNHITHKGKSKRTMVCSQLVYQIYLDCGRDYTIRIANLLDQKAQNNGQTICLAKLIEEAEEDMMPNTQGEQMEPDRYDIEMVSRELYQVLCETETEENDQLVYTAMLGNIVAKGQRFMDLLEQILEHTHLDIPIPALFITPADIYERAKNLKRIDDCDLKRL